MTVDEKIRDGKLQHDINRETAKISPLSSGKNHIWISYKWRSITLWSEKSDITSELYLFSFNKSFAKTNKTDCRSKKKTNISLKILKPNAQKLKIKGTL